MQIQIAVQQQLAKFRPDRSAARIANLQHIVPEIRQMRGQPINLCRLADAVDAVERDEHGFAFDVSHFVVRYSAFAGRCAVLVGTTGDRHVAIVRHNPVTVPLLKLQDQPPWDTHVADPVDRLTLTFTLMSTSASSGKRSLDDVDAADAC